MSSLPERVWERKTTPTRVWTFPAEVAPEQPAGEVARGWACARPWASGQLHVIKRMAGGDPYNPRRRVFAYFVEDGKVWFRTWYSDEGLV